jgi:hypothetical protein
MSSKNFAIRSMLPFVVFVWLGSIDQFAHAQPIENSESRDPRDFAEYWASAHLLLSGKNPYSPEEMLSLQQTIVASRVYPVLSWNPPWTLCFTAPFGLMSLPIAHFLWLLTSIACLILCPSSLWKLYGGGPGKSRITWLICFALIQTYLVLILRQIVPLLLLGIVGFLYFYRRRLLFVSGLSLTLVAIKPHLAFLLWLALLFWTVHQRQFRVMVGLVMGLASTTLLPLFLVPDVFSFYFQQYSTRLAPKPLEWQTSTVSAALAYLVGSNTLWIRVIPTLLGAIWFIFYWKKNRNRWDWVEQTPPLLLASQVATPFGWLFDQILLLPALIQVVVWTSQGTTATIFKRVAVGFVVIDLLPLVVVEVAPNYLWLFWMVPLYSLAYIRMKRQIFFSGKIVASAIESPDRVRLE